jgi:hypothetical protein
MKELFPISFLYRNQGEPNGGGLQRDVKINGPAPGENIEISYKNKEPVKFMRTIVMGTP